MEDSVQSSGAALGVPPSILAEITRPGQTSRVNMNPVLEQVHWHTHKAWLERSRKKEEFLL